MYIAYIYIHIYVSAPEGECRGAWDPEGTYVCVMTKLSLSSSLYLPMCARVYIYICMYICILMHMRYILKWHIALSLVCFLSFQ